MLTCQRTGTERQERLLKKKFPISVLLRLHFYSKESMKKEGCERHEYLPRHVSSRPNGGLEHQIERNRRGQVIPSDR